MNITKKIYLDRIRIVACMFVIIHHTVNNLFLYTTPSGTWFVAFTAFLMCRPAIALFLMVSGATLLGKEDDYKKTWKRFSRIVIVLFAFSLLYYVNSCVVTGESFSVPGYLQRMFYDHATSAIWYLYLYAAILLMLPLLQKLVSAMKEADYKYYLIIAVGVCGAVPILQFIMPELTLFEDFNLVIFQAYIAMVIAGYYLDRFVKMDRKKCLICLAVYVGCTALNDGLTYGAYLYNREHYLFLNETQAITMIIPAMCLFLMAKYIWRPEENLDKAKESLSAGAKVWDNLLTQAAACSFGIYLFSDLFLGKFAPLQDICNRSFHPLISVVIYQAAIFGAGFLVTFVLKKVPYVNRYI